MNREMMICTGKIKQELINCKKYDTEEAHAKADEILCDLLTQLGYKNIVELWRDVDKWYA